MGGERRSYQARYYYKEWEWEIDRHDSETEDIYRLKLPGMRQKITSEIKCLRKRKKVKNAKMKNKLKKKIKKYNQN